MKTRLKIICVLMLLPFLTAAAPHARQFAAELAAARLALDDLKALARAVMAGHAVEAVAEGQDR